jgi:hypothetical protein
MRPPGAATLPEPPAHREEVGELAVELACLVVEQAVDVGTRRPPPLPDHQDRLDLGQAEPEPARLLDEAQGVDRVGGVDAIPVGAARRGVRLRRSSTSPHRHDFAGCSKACAARSTVASSRCRPTSIMPTGSPSELPQGTVRAGWPVTSNGQVTGDDQGYTAPFGLGAALVSARAPRDRSTGRASRGAGARPARTPARRVDRHRPPATSTRSSRRRARRSSSARRRGRRSVAS